MATGPDPQDYLRAYVAVQRPADAAILRLLRDAYKDVNAQLGRLQRERGPGAELRRDQLRAIKKSILENQAEVFRRVGKIIEVRRVEAAARAIHVAGRYDQAVFALGHREEDAEALTDALETTETRAIDVALARLTGSATTLASRVYRAEAYNSGRLERRINSALARGLSAAEFAAEIREFVNPGTPGGTRYAALRLARTEINNAVHAIAVREAQLKPWIKGMEWHTSRSHPKPDECDQLNGQIFKPEDVPRKPHPNCMCFVTPVVNAEGTDAADDEAFLDGLVSGEFDDFLDDIIRSTGQTPPPRVEAPEPVPQPVKRAPRKAAQPKKVNQITGEAGQRVDEMLAVQEQMSPNAMRSLRSVSYGRVSSGENGAYDPHLRKIVLGRNLSVSERPIRDKTEKIDPFTNASYNTRCGHEFSDLQCTLAHEYGHHIDRVARENPAAVETMANSVADALGLTRPEAYHVVAIDEWVKANRRQIRTAISKYGSSNFPELIAEVWAEYSTNPEARSQIKAIGRTLQQLAENNR